MIENSDIHFIKSCVSKLIDKFNNQFSKKISKMIIFVKASL